jgi:hypothetical protein
MTMKNISENNTTTLHDAYITKRLSYKTSIITKYPCNVMSIATCISYTEKYKPHLTHGLDHPAEPRLCQEPVHVATLLHIPPRFRLSRWDRMNHWAPKKHSYSKICHVTFLLQDILCHVELTSRTLHIWWHHNVMWCHTLCDADVLCK